MVATSENTIAGSLWEWLLKRGILYFLTQTPLIALMVGYFFRWTNTPTATAFTVILAFIILPIWVLYRKDRSDDPTEPVHHLPRYALFALVPYVVYNFARIPMHYLLQIVFWDHWYDFGFELTGQPVDQWSSLIPGTFIHSLQGYVLALGFYILYRRHSLINALIYVFLFLSLVYTWSFPAYILVDFQPPAKWFFVVWWAHFWMALAAWIVPTTLYSPGFWSRINRRPVKALLIVVIVVLYFVPVTFVFWRAATWQFATQYDIDQANFDQVGLVLVEDPIFTGIEPISGQSPPEARYQFTLRFGPRNYQDYINATKSLDAGPIQVTGRLLHQGEIVAFCWAYVEMLESPNTILLPADYFPALEQMEYTDIPVECRGTAEAAERLAEDAQVQVEWTAEVMLIGDRETRQQTFTATIED